MRTWTDREMERDTGRDMDGNTDWDRYKIKKVMRMPPMLHKKSPNCCEKILSRNVHTTKFFSLTSYRAPAKINNLFLQELFVRYHTGGSMKLNACILHLAHMVYL
jgi:predicted nucleotidyltransferase